MVRILIVANRKIHNTRGELKCLNGTGSVLILFLIIVEGNNFKNPLADQEGNNSTKSFGECEETKRDETLGSQILFLKAKDSVMEMSEWYSTLKTKVTYKQLKENNFK